MYVSAPAGTPGRKLTDGPADAQPAPSPDLTKVAFVRDSAPGGGELWVLDLSPELTAVGQPRRLVDRATLPRGNSKATPAIGSPRWSPAGDRVAFVANPTDGAVDGGYLLVAAADTGALVPGDQTSFAASWFAWSPDGGHLAWLNERSDVRPTNVNTLAVGGASTPVVTGTNAFAVAYGRDGQTLVFANGDTAAVGDEDNPFTVRDGGIYSVPASGGGATPTSRYSKRGSYFSDLAVLGSGAIAFVTQENARGGPQPKTIQVLDQGASAPRTVVTDVGDAVSCRETANGSGWCNPAQEPAWSASDLVAYVDSSPERFLVVTDADNRDPHRVDAGVETFGWAPAGR